MTKKSVTKKIDFKETLWKSADKLRNQMDAAEYKHIVLGLIFLKYISDTFDIQKNKIKQTVSDKNSDLFISEDPKVYERELEDRDYYTKDNVFWVPQKARWARLCAQAKQSDIGAIIDKSMVDIENENNFLKGKLDKRFGRSQLQEGKLGQLIDLISKISFTDEQKASDMLGEVYEYFLGKFASAEGKKGGQFYTPRNIVRILVEILSPNKGRIYDPCCGSGGMFVQSEEFVKSHGGKVDDVSIYGQESNPTTWRLAAMNLAIRGFSADLGNSHGDSFSNDKHEDKKFDFILINPPFNDSDWDGEKYLNDRRFVFGNPPISNANYAWLQLVLYKLNKFGRAGIILGNGALNAKDSEYHIRKKIIEEDLIDCMVGLPGQLFSNTPTPVTLWFINKNKKNRSKQVLFIDGRKLGYRFTKKLRVLDDKDIYKISNTYQNWLTKSDYEDEAGFCKSIKIDEIRSNDYSLSPIRYVDFPNVLDTKQLNFEIEHLNNEIEKSKIKIDL
jgi:type I restriction enzyme M protein